MTEKKKNQPLNPISEPRPIRHMMLWGAVAGQILGVLYIAGLIGLVADSGNPFLPLLYVIMPFTWVFAFTFGAIPGVLLGFFDGWLLRRMVSPDEIFTQADMQRKKNRVYGAIFGLTLLLLSPLLLIGLEILFLFGAPMIIAAIAAAYASHRYMFRLRDWQYFEGITRDSRKLKHEELEAYDRLMQVDDTQFDDLEGLSDEGKKYRNVQ